ncbi:MAG: excisionase family DNA-binding protein [Chloroflexota bacterium]|nr:excisionase family DNA-binding protein [Chloroflexota bacterium]
MIVVTAAEMRDATTAATGIVTVTTAEAARLAGVTPRTIRRWLQAGWLASVEAGGERRISPADLPAAKALARRRAQEGRRRGHGRAGAWAGVAATADATGDTTGDTTRDATTGPLMVAPGTLAQLLERVGALEREGGELRGRLAMAAAVMAAKDETIAELRRRAEAAERELARGRGVQDSRAVPAPAVGFWRRVWGALAGDVGG